jgi:mannitol 2-dehydrogenase
MNLSTGEILNDFYANDMSCFLNNPEFLNTAVGQIVYGLQLRRDLNLAPFTILSCDNVQENGCKTKDVVLTFAEAVDPKLRSWIETNAAFPNSMVDRITPRATDADRDDIKARFGIDDAIPVVSEDFTQWVIEDKFTNGKLPVDTEENVLFVDDVLPYELMKLRLLNSSHQVLAYPAILLGFRLVHSSLLESVEMRTFLEVYMRLIASTLPPVTGVDFNDYINTLLRRYSNANCPDTLLRLSEDSVNRLETAFIASVENTMHQKEVMAFPLACWIHYWATSTDALGQEFVRTPDERAESSIGLFESCATEPTFEKVAQILSQSFTRTAFDDSFVSCVEEYVSRISSDGVCTTMGQINSQFYKTL